MIYLSEVWDFFLRHYLNFSNVFYYVHPWNNCSIIRLIYVSSNVIFRHRLYDHRQDHQEVMTWETWEFIDTFPRLTLTQCPVFCWISLQENCDLGEERGWGVRLWNPGKRDLPARGWIHKMVLRKFGNSKKIFKQLLHSQDWFTKHTVWKKCF